MLKLKQFRDMLGTIIETGDILVYKIYQMPIILLVTEFGEHTVIGYELAVKSMTGEKLKNPIFIKWKTYIKRPERGLVIPVEALPPKYQLPFLEYGKD